MSDEKVVDRLDRLISLLEMAFEHSITEARRRFRADRIAVAIVDACRDGWVPSGELQRRLAADLSVSERTIRDRLVELVAKGAVRSRGAGRSTEYTATGLY